MQNYAPIGEDPRRRPKFAMLAAICLALMLCLVYPTKKPSSAAMSQDSSANLGQDHHPHLVTALPGLPEEYTAPMYAGFVDIAKTSSLFYWMFAAEEAPMQAPLVIWLNGGPGASSLTGALLENGPMRLNADGKTAYNEFGWTKEANVAFIDNPVGAGFSYTDNEDGYVNDLSEMAEQLYTGIIEILELHPWLAASPIYIAGESYAGKYIPAIAHYIYRRHEDGDTIVNLEGIMIGNGETKPYIAYASTPDYLFRMGYIDETQQRWAHKQLKVCKEQVEKEEYILAFETCQKVEDDLFAKYVKLPFIYDLRAKSDVFTELTAVMTDWINQLDVRKALNVGERMWRQSDGQGPSSVGKPVPEHLKGDEMLDIPDEILQDLYENFRVLLFNGQFDGSSCNALGTKRMLHELDWVGKAAFEATQQSAWSVKGGVAGYGKTGISLNGEVTFLLVANSGHLVPSDQPENALDMLRRFINKEAFFD